MEIIQEYNINGKKIIYAKYTKAERELMNKKPAENQELPKTEEVTQIEDIAVDVE